MGTTNNPGHTLAAGWLPWDVDGDELFGHQPVTVWPDDDGQVHLRRCDGTTVGREAYLPVPDALAQLGDCCTHTTNARTQLLRSSSLELVSPIVEKALDAHEALEQATVPGAQTTTAVLSVCTALRDVFAKQARSGQLPTDVVGDLTARWQHLWGRIAPGPEILGRHAILWAGRGRHGSNLSSRTVAAAALALRDLPGDVRDIGKVTHLMLDEMPPRPDNPSIYLAATGAILRLMPELSDDARDRHGRHVAATFGAYLDATAEHDRTQPRQLVQYTGGRTNGTSLLTVALVDGDLAHLSTDPVLSVTPAQADVLVDVDEVALDLGPVPARWDQLDTAQKAELVDVAEEIGGATNKVGEIQLSLRLAAHTLDLQID